MEGRLQLRLGGRAGWLRAWSTVALALLAAGPGPGAETTPGASPAAASASQKRRAVDRKPAWVEQQWGKLSARQKQMFEDGFLDVTVYDGWEGNAVDPAGVKDSTRALNAAIVAGREGDLVAYFPAGTYLVSDTLNCMHPARIYFARLRQETINNPSRDHNNCQLYGDRAGRPVIRLKDGAAGFGDPAAPKHLLTMWQQDKPEVTNDCRQTLACAYYYGILDGIALDCGRNPGAIGLFYKGAQGSMVANVRIVATHAYAGLEGGSWATGGVYGLEVEGGRYGVLIDGNPPCYVGLTLRNQSEAALKFDHGQGAITVCGFRIEAPQGPVLALPADGRFGNSVHGNLTLMDGTIELSDGGTAIDNVVGKNLYLENVYLRGAAAAVKSAEEPPVACGAGWTHIAQYSYCNKNTKADDSGWNSQQSPSDCLIDGKVTKQTGLRLRANAPVPPADLIARHLWGKIPEYGDGDPAVKNAVRDLGLDNTGSNVVTAALQAAIDRHEKIFLPKGRYLLDGTVTLRAHTKLFGGSPNNTVLEVSRDWQPARETPILITEDAPDGTAVLGNLIVACPAKPAKTYNFNVLTWRVGRKSVLRQVVGNAEWLDPRTTPGYALTRFRIQGGGGGRWYSCIHEVGGDSRDPDFHVLGIENTTEPLTFYHYGGIHSQGGDQTVIRNARNVRFVGYNLETGGLNNIFHARASRNIGFYGFGNEAVPGKRGMALVRLTDCEDVLCAMFSQGKHLNSANTNAFQVLEARVGHEGGLGIAGDRVLCLYSKGAFCYPE